MQIAGVFTEGRLVLQSRCWGGREGGEKSGLFPTAAPEQPGKEPPGQPLSLHPTGGLCRAVRPGFTFRLSQAALPLPASPLHSCCFSFPKPKPTAVVFPVAFVWQGQVGSVMVALKRGGGEGCRDQDSCSQQALHQPALRPPLLDLQSTRFSIK